MDQAVQPDEDGVIHDAKLEERPLSILVTLGRLHDGRLLTQMQIQLAEVVQEVVNNHEGKGGKLILELSVDRPSAKLHLTGREIIITAALKTKLPDDPPNSAVFYYDDQGGLHNNDPTIRRLPFSDSPR